MHQNECRTTLSGATQGDGIRRLLVAAIHFFKHLMMHVRTRRVPDLVTGGGGGILPPAGIWGGGTSRVRGEQVTECSVSVCDLEASLHNKHICRFVVCAEDPFILVLHDTRL